MDGEPESVNRDSHEAPAERDRILELNFVPNWARKPPGDSQIFSSNDSRAPRRESRGRQDRHDRPRRPDQGSRPRPQPRPQPPRARREFPPSDFHMEPPPVSVRFLPEQKHLSAVVHRLHKTRHSYPLMGLAAIFLANPDFCYLKIEPLRGGDSVALFQCKVCGMVATDKESFSTHLLKNHFEDYFEKEEVLLDAPSGVFVCVARCTLTRTLLGPPNHHSYAEKIQELLRTRYPQMSMEEFSSHIETVRDPDLIEQWREEARKQTVFKRKGSGDGEAPGVSWSAAEALFLREIAPDLIVESGKSATVSVAVARQMEDRRLLAVIREAWNQEDRFPRSLSSALRAAFRHKHLHLFKAGRGREFVTATRPAPLDPDHAVDSIREVLLHLRDHPGCTRKKMIEDLRPGMAEDSPEVMAILSPLTWLVEKGHIIEFFDGTMSVPLSEG